MFQISQEGKDNLADPADPHHHCKDDGVEELILPDLLDHTVPSLEGVDDHVGTEKNQVGPGVHGDSLRQARSQHESGGVDEAVVGQNLPALAFVGSEPVGLEGEITDEVDGHGHEEWPKNEGREGCEHDALLGCAVVSRGLNFLT